MEGRTDGGKNGGTEGLTGGQMDGQTDGRTGFSPSRYVIFKEEYVCSGVSCSPETVKSFPAGPFKLFIYLFLG